MLYPTNAEMRILDVLWTHGASTVRAVHAALTARPVGYTTVLKTMQIMVGKGLVTRDATRRSHVYAPIFERSTVQTGMLRQFADRVFAGSIPALVEHAVLTMDADARARVSTPSASSELGSDAVLADPIRSTPNPEVSS